MIAAIVFSRDRAMQLDLLLRSLDENGARLFKPIVVLFRATSPDHEKAYRVCRDEHPDVEFIPDGGTSFRVAARMTWNKDWACFFTDDSVLYRPLPDMLPLPPPGTLCFSLRLGRNTTYCYPLDRRQSWPLFLTEGDGSLTWDWREAEGDFSYPASVDGHIFRGATLRPVLFDAPADANPNEIEEHLVRAFANDRDRMASYEHSVLVGLPINRVNQTHANRHGIYPHDDVNNLLRSYLKGKRIDLDALDFSDVRGAHQEIPLVLT